MIESHARKLNCPLMSKPGSPVTCTARECAVWRQMADDNQTIEPHMLALYKADGYAEISMIKAQDTRGIFGKPVGEPRIMHKVRARTGQCGMISISGWQP